MMLQLALRSAERIRDRDVDVFVRDVRDGDFATGHLEHEAHLELATVSVSLVRLADAHAALRDAVVDVLEAGDPTLDRGLGRITMLDTVKRDLGRNLH